jgi:hypothetical protein
VLGDKPGTWNTPLASVTPSMARGSTALVIVTVAPGMRAPC